MDGKDIHDADKAPPDRLGVPASPVFPIPTKSEVHMWTLLGFAFTGVLYFLGIIGVIVLGLTCPLWIGFLALWMGLRWGWVQIRGT